MRDDDLSCDREVLKRYAGQVVVYRDRQIWGAGPDLDSALAVALAQPGCPEEKRLRIAIIPDDDSNRPPLIPEEFFDPPSEISSEVI